VRKNVATPYDKFYFDEKYHFSIFHEHKDTKLNHFSPISKVLNFWVLQIYPLKMNLVLEIWKRHGFQKRNRKKILTSLSTSIPNLNTYV